MNFIFLLTSLGLLFALFVAASHDTALVGLYEEPEKPENPVDYIKQYLGGSGEIDIEALKSENEELKKKVEALESKVDELSKKDRPTESAASSGEATA